MADYYSLLGLRPGATGSEIKRAFREKAKLLHPDLVGSSSGDAMRNLIEAYETLSDLDLRREYDRQHRVEFEKFVFDYRTFLKEHLENPVNRSKLVFFELLHDFNDDAVATWREGHEAGWSLETDMDREDAMDCAFILAEELEKRGDYENAFKLYIYTAREERKKPYFKHFYPEVLLKLKELVRVKLPRKKHGNQLAPFLKAILELRLDERERSWYRNRLSSLGD